jgi:hypothetical protein
MVRTVAAMMTAEDVFEEGMVEIAPAPGFRIIAIALGQKW